MSTHKANKRLYLFFHIILLDSSIFRYLRSRQARCLAWAVEQSYINRFIYSRYKRYTYSHLLFNSWRKAAIGFNCKDYPRGKQLGLQTPRSVCTRTHQRRKSPLEDDRQAEQHSTYLWQHSRVCSPCAQNRCNVPSHCIPSRNLLPPMIIWVHIRKHTYYRKILSLYQNINKNSSADWSVWNLRGKQQSLKLGELILSLLVMGLKNSPYH